MGNLRNKLALFAGVGVLALGVGTTGAVAADLIGSKDIKDDSVRSADLKDDAAVKARDLHSSVENKFARLQQEIDALEARVADLENSSTTAEWTTSDGAEIVDSSTASLAIDTGGATSIETNDLNVPVQAGDVISFDIELKDGATCTAGAPRMFVEIAGEFYNSYDDQTGCADDGPPPSTEDGTVTFTVPTNGRIGQAGFVYDNGIAGTVEFSNVTIDGNPVAFN